MCPSPRLLSACREEANISVSVVRDASVCNLLSTWFGYIVWRWMNFIALMGLCIRIDVGRNGRR